MTSRATRFFVPALLLVLAGCDRTLHEFRHTVYAPKEAGLTLIYENPAITDSGKRFSDRLQVRVASVKETPEGSMIQLTSSTLQGQQSTLCQVHNGGWTLVVDDKHRTPILPEGFPDRVSNWDRPGSHARVLGRASADLPELKLPQDFDHIGVWVESESASGLTRTFYMSGIGEAETRVLRGGRWICVNRLISRGFTDVPETKPES